MDLPQPIVIVGQGRLARTVAPILRVGGRSVVTAGRGDIPPAPLTWILVPDRAIAEVAARVTPGGIVLHASGALGLDALAPHRQVAVLHPVMTFPGGTRPPLVPATVSGVPEAVEVATALGQSLGWSVVPFSGDRTLYHAACVMAGNYGAALFAEASRVLALAGVDGGNARRLLGPLALASIEQAIERGPEALTGPVARGDTAVVDAHRTALRARDADLLALYDALRVVTERLVSQKRA